MQPVTDETPNDKGAARYEEDLGVAYLAEAKGISIDAARQRLRIQNRTSLIADPARALLGDRLGEIRFDDDGYIRFTIIDMTPADIEAIGRIARETGLAEWVRTERADPVHLQTWEELRHELIRLRETRRDVLMGHPMPTLGYRRPPVEIRLAPYATDVAAALHERFGEFVALRVGVLPYPLQLNESRLRSEQPRPTINPAEIHVELDGPLNVSSGHAAKHGLNVTNNGDGELVVNTNGHLTAHIIDPTSGQIVGSYTGGQHAILIRFPIPPDNTVRIPLLVGTASFDPKLGYAIPPGSWALRCTLKLADGRSLNTPPLAFTVID